MYRHLAAEPATAFDDEVFHQTSPGRSCIARYRRTLLSRTFDRLKAAAQAEIEQDVNRAKEELRKRVAVLALAGAEKILQANIDESANRALVDKLAAEL